MKYIYHHLGLGDHIICNGLVRNLINTHEHFIMFVKQHNLATVKFMYRDLPNLSFIVGDDQYALDFLNRNNIDRSNIIFAGFDRHPSSKEFDDSFYLQNNIPFEKRWADFRCDRDPIAEKKLFEKYKVKEHNYVFIHDDHSRNLIIDESHVMNKKLPIIRPIIGYTQNAFDYCYLMQNSIETHFIDSSFRLIFDSLQLRNTNIFYHLSYKNVKRDNTKAQSFLNFQIL